LADMSFDDIPCKGLVIGYDTVDLFQS